MSGTCSWNTHQEGILIDTFKKAKADGQQSESGWKPVVYERIVEELAGTEVESGGPPKDKSQVKSRWQRFKTEYKIVKKLRNASGFGWDSERGIVTASREVWDAYVKVHTEARKFEDKPFPFFDDIAELVDGVIADGRGAFRPGRSNQGHTANANVPMNMSATSSASVNTTTTTTTAVTSAAANSTSTLYTKLSASASDASISDTEDADEKTADSLDKSSQVDASKTSASPNTKKGRQSGAAAIFALSKSLDSVVNSFDSTAQQGTSQMPLASPQRKTAAIRAIEKDEELSDEEMINVADLLRERTDIADTYLALTKKSTRSAYLRKQLDRYL